MMQLLIDALNRIPEFQQLLSALEGGRSPAALSGVAAVHRAHMAAGIGTMTGRPVVVVCADEGEGERLARDLAAFVGQEVPVLTPRSFTFHNAATVSRQWEHRRLALMEKLAAGRLPFLVATVEGLLQRTLPPQALEQYCFRLKVGQSQDLAQLAEALSAAGYIRCDQVEGVGQFALRGGILDVYAPGMDAPARVEFFGDEVDAMGSFDLSTQRRTENLEEVRLLPAAETLPQLAPGGLAGLSERLRQLAAKAAQNGLKELAATLEQDREAISQGRSFPAMDRYLPLIYPKAASAAHYLPGDACVVFSECARVADRAKTWQWQLDEDVKSLLERGLLDGSCGELSLTFSQLTALLRDWPVVYLDSFTTSAYPDPPKVLLSITAKQLPSFGASLETAVQDLAHYQNSGFSSLVLVSGEQRALDLQGLLREQKVKSAVDFQMKELPRPGQTVITVGGLSGGMEYPSIQLAVITEGDPRAIKKPRARKDATNRQKLKSYADLSPGDLVVHEHHGVGRYVGMVKMQVDGVEKDYVKIAYAGTDVLYVPATQLDMVSKYIGGGEDAAETKKLNKLGGTEWEKAKTRAKKAVQDLAKGLIQLYAQRQRQPGYAFSPDSPWQREFEEQFEYTETEDQLRCIQEIKTDMERASPMDRLLCGDVGYGKTEVAFRAMMKCVLDGKQAAILVPTTVLARQHYLTALRRFAKYPVNIDVVSRFRTPAQMKETLRQVENGSVDILIGTHRLFNKDVKFKDLGLLVVDEEQRFGVQHKEKLKEQFKQVDVLTLSATPIPRTLNMALSGIRDMSTLEEPPADRQPVQTYVLEHDWGVLADAMRRELERGGQVYYLHNRVETIDRTAGRIQAMLPDARVAVAHGKMTQEAINDVMSQMTDGEVDILVCTTIIETGIDIPNANTLIIEDADKMGLSQLHQLRGRVGRSARRAFAYMTYRKGKVLTEVQTKRLAAIREFAEFGSGFKIAMRDLEIRGAGNVLGPEQSGFLVSVGYDMYLKLLEEAVLEEKGERSQLPAECAADLTVAASIPDKYVPSPEQRMDLYRRIARIRSEHDADDLVDELIDRYGDPPRTVNNLISVALLRAAAAACGISEIAQKGERLLFVLSQVDFNKVSALCGGQTYRGRLLFSAGEKPHLALKLKKGEDPLKLATKLVEDYAAQTPPPPASTAAP